MTTDYFDYYYSFIDRAIDTSDLELDQRSYLNRMMVDKYLRVLNLDYPIGWNLGDGDSKEPFQCFTYTDGSLVLYVCDTDAIERDADENISSLSHEMLSPLHNFFVCSRTSSGELDIHSASTRSIVSKLIAEYPSEDLESVEVVLLSLAPEFSKPMLKISVDEGFNYILRTVGIRDLWEINSELPTPVIASEENSEQSDISSPQKEQAAVENQTPTIDSPLPETPNFAPLPYQEANGDINEADTTSLKGAEDYRYKLIAEAKNEGYGKNNLFTILADRLCDVDKFEVITEAHCPERRVGMYRVGVDGWSFDETNDVLTLFYLDYSDSDQPETFGKSDAERILNKLKNFFKFSGNGTLDEDILDINTDEATLAFWIADRINARSGNDDGIPAFSRINFWILTTRKKTKNLALPDGDIEGFDYRVTVLDYNDFYDFEKSTAELQVDFMRDEFGGKPLRMLPAVNDRTTGYSAYVGLIPGETLANLYKEYGQRILASNVRAFLNTTIKVNKGIQQTIKNDPERFFAFNNGICVVCSAIEKDLKDGVTLLTGATDFQIVNGGQTTASLHYAAVTKNLPLGEVRVPMKLTVIPVQEQSYERQKFVLEIAKYANSQTAVTVSDLGSNTEFQVRFQSWGLSGNCSYQNKGCVCYWYYERTRGEYKVVLRNHSSKKKFEESHPNKFTKIDLAKWLLAWETSPHTVSLGAQKCFTAFSKILDEKEKQDPKLTFCTANFFKQAVAKGILFRTIDRLVLSAEWYKKERSYKANIVAYAMSLFAKGIKDNFGEEYDFDWLSVWDKQAIDQEILPLLDRLAQYARFTFDREDRDVHDVGEWVKKENCWKMASAEPVDFGEHLENVRKLTVVRTPSFYMK